MFMFQFDPWRRTIIVFVNNREAWNVSIVHVRLMGLSSIIEKNNCEFWEGSAPGGEKQQDYLKTNSIF